jgi:hypothetical protein
MILKLIIPKSIILLDKAKRTHDVREHEFSIWFALRNRYSKLINLPVSGPTQR